METNKDLSIEHQNVPIAHQGLHGFLYSSDDEHSATVTVLDGENNGGTEVLPIDVWRDRSTNAKVAGVYAVLDSKRHTQYINYSRNVLLSLNGHLAENGVEKCAFVQVQTFKFPKREEMEKVRDRWLAELDYIPPGNADVNGTWVSTIGEIAKAAMTEAERQVYEEKKLKLRKAMADTTLTKETEAIVLNEDEQRRNLEAAVKNDDWSSVIAVQTQETKPNH